MAEPSVKDGYYCCRHFQCVGKHEKGCPNFWDVARVKDELPDVQVVIDGIRHTGQLAGRQLQFAHIHLHGTTGYMGVEFAWETIADCLNRGVPLRA